MQHVKDAGQSDIGIWVFDVPAVPVVKRPRDSNRIAKQSLIKEHRCNCYAPSVVSFAVNEMALQVPFGKG